jgi:glycosyltransferase involved in cell wall biosynthesis
MEHSVELAVILLTKNEEAMIGGALQSVQGIADVSVVLDSESTDRTRELAESLGAVVVTRPFDNFSAQRNFGLDYIDTHFNPKWVLSLDADERVSAALAEELRLLKNEEPPVADVYLLPVRMRFSGRDLCHGGFGRTVAARLFRPRAGRYEERGINEHFIAIDGAKIRRAKAPLLHEDVRSWSRYILKHNQYSTLEAEARLAREREGESSVTLRLAFAQQHLRHRFLRERVWEKLPGRPAIRFVQMFVLSRGFLDGTAGFRTALFRAWQEMCIDCKYEEFKGRGRSSRAEQDGV